MKADEKKYFPMFVDLTQKKVTVIGAGNIAKRRIETLLSFAGTIEVIAPDRKSTRLNSSHIEESRMPSSA